LDDLTEHFCYSREKRRIAIFFRDKIAFLLKPMGCLEFHQSTNPSFPRFKPRSPPRTPHGQPSVLVGFVSVFAGESTIPAQETRLLPGYCGSCTQFGTIRENHPETGYQPFHESWPVAVSTPAACIRLLSISKGPRNIAFQQIPHFCETCRDRT
jgi:hypothetical protein